MSITSNYIAGAVVKLLSTEYPVTEGGHNPYVCAKVESDDVKRCGFGNPVLYPLQVGISTMGVTAGQWLLHRFMYVLHCLTVH